MVEFGGRYRPRNATWYKDMDVGFLKPEKTAQLKEKPQPIKIGLTESSKIDINEGKIMLGKIINNMNNKKIQDKNIMKKIYG